MEYKLRYWRFFWSYTLALPDLIPNVPHWFPAWASVHCPRCALSRCRRDVQLSSVVVASCRVDQWFFALPDPERLLQSVYWWNAANLARIEAWERIEHRLPLLLLRRWWDAPYSVFVCAVAFHPLGKYSNLAPHGKWNHFCWTYCPCLAYWPHAVPEDTRWCFVFRSLQVDCHWNSRHRPRP